MSYRIAVYLLGMLVNFFGVALLIKATLGAGFWTALFVGLSDLFGLTVGMWYAAFQLIFIFINAGLVKQTPEWKAIVPLVLESLILDFWLEIVLHNLSLSSAPFMVQFTFLVIGIGLSALGVAIYILPQLPRAPVDQLFLAISHRLKFSLRVSQTMVALTTSTTALLIGGPVGIGTALGVAFAGPIIQYCYVRGYPLYFQYHPHYQERFELSM
ncbi:YitT family protein [Pontibacillus sp. HMF3514]|uniref:YczE/YyaS/YitT family protein n=1 Tax=Pontibacillus sp. HMF3514 TaxID=2692425 RepID=UPI00131FA5EF|nr:hypothetical protein [Pontibacillus sp. HMF3514]QHE53946.1 hypothetical protein GS400_18810 [Pontibacillus sp. HMF3514]